MRGLTGWGVVGLLVLGGCAGEALTSDERDVMSYTYDAPPEDVTFYTTYRGTDAGPPVSDAGSGSDSPSAAR